MMNFDYMTGFSHPSDHYTYKSCYQGYDDQYSQPVDLYAYHHDYTNPKRFFTERNYPEYSSFQGSAYGYPAHIFDFHKNDALNPYEQSQFYPSNPYRHGVEFHTRFMFNPNHYHSQEVHPTPTFHDPRYSVLPSNGYRQISNAHNSPIYSAQIKADMSLDVKLKLIGAQRNSPSNEIPANQLCAVCGDNAACQHYGVRTCEGCKGFFKRTVQKKAKYTCLGDKNCPVDKRRRNRCQYCRYQKCLAVGMVKEVVRTDALKGRRGRLPAKPKSPCSNSQANSVNSFQMQLIKLFNESQPPQAHLDFSKYQNTPENAEEHRRIVYESLINSCEMGRSWVDKLAKLIGLDVKDLLDRRASMILVELVLLRIALRLQENALRIVLCDGRVCHKSQMITLCGETVVENIYKLAEKIKSVSTHQFVGPALCAIILLDDPFIQQSSLAADYFKKVLDELTQVLGGSNSKREEILDSMKILWYSGQQIKKPLLLYHRQFSSACMENVLFNSLDYELEGGNETKVDNQWYKEEPDQYIIQQLD